MIRSPNSLLLRLGRVITRVMLSHPLRSSRLARRAYAAMYLLGKSISESGERDFFRRSITPGMVVFDIGANVGFYTELYSELVGASGRVYAFEPDPYCFGILEDRLSRFTCQNVTAVPFALGDREGMVTLHCHPTNRADNRIAPIPAEAEAEQVDVPIATLDAWCAEQRIERIDAVKMDVQGAEVGVLRGMKRLVTQSPPDWMFLEFAPAELRLAGSGPEEFWATLREYGYSVTAFDEKFESRPIADSTAFTRETGEWYTNVLARRPATRSAGPRSD